MRRAVHFAVLSVLLLIMQQQVLVHPIAHLAGHGAPLQETSLSVPHPAADCVECALLAGGFNTVHGDPEANNSAPPPATPVLATFQSRAADVPAWFQSRAPPSLL